VILISVPEGLRHLIGMSELIAIVGRPNVGKSSLLNRLLNEERVMVSDMPGTTRDAIDATLTWHRRRFRIVDTAGMRRPGRVRGGGLVELVSVAGAKNAIFEADVVALVLDAKEGATDQDAAIGGEADRAGRGVVIIANKWDLVRNTERNFSSSSADQVSPFASIPSRRTWGRTTEACSPPITEIRAFGHIQRKRGL